MKMGRIPDSEKEDRLPDRYMAFVNEYFANGFVGKKAAVAVGYSEKSHNDAWRLLNDPRVRAEIDRRFAEMHMSSSEILSRLAEHARATYAQYITPEGEIDVAQMVADGNAHLIKRISYDKYNNKVYEFNDVQAALQLLGKHDRLFVNKTEISGADGGPIQVEDANLTPEEKVRRLEAALRIAKKKLESDQE